ncbi:MAG: hypothetical protein E7311_04675 [Clostridiales bacterium]|nr:hypothetical protein [Clostridiales bacterium]
MKKYFKTIVLSIVMLFAITICVNAENWYESGYNWARDIGIIERKSYSQLGKNVDIVEFYDILFKYFEQNNMLIYYKYQKQDDYKNDNYALVATDRKLTSLANKEWLTNSEYKTAKNLIDKARELIDRNTKYFTSSEIKSIEYYLDVMNYILYHKIYDYDYKITQSVKKPKNGDMFIKYHMIPLYGEITREEFLILMHRYRIDQEETNTAKIIKSYTDAGILLGYDNNLMLTVKMTYAHLTTFLSRM